MKKNPGRKERRRQKWLETSKPGDLNRKKTHKMRSRDGMSGGSTLQKEREVGKDIQ